MPISNMHFNNNNNGNNENTNTTSSTAAPLAKSKFFFNNTILSNHNQSVNSNFKFNPFVTKFSEPLQHQYEQHYNSFNKSHHVDTPIPSINKHENKTNNNYNNLPKKKNNLFSTLLHEQQNNEVVTKNINQQKSFVKQIPNKLRSESMNNSSLSSKDFNNILHNKKSGKILKRSKKVPNSGILQSFNLVEKEKYRLLLEENMCKTNENQTRTLFDQNTYSDFVKTSPTQTRDDNEFSIVNLPVSKFVKAKNTQIGHVRRASSSTFSTQSSPAQYHRNISTNEKTALPEVIVINEKRNSTIINTANTSNQAFLKNKPLKSMSNGTSLNNISQINNNKAPSLLSSRILAPSHKISRELTDYEKRINDKSQHTNNIIESIIEKCRDKKYSIVEEESKYNLIKRQRFEEETKLAKQFSERLQLDTNKLSKYYYEEESEEEVDEFVTLTCEQESFISKAFIPYPSDEILANGFNVNITRKDIQTLKGLNWLNDEVINFYMNLICERSEQTPDRRAYAFTTFFYPKLLKDGYSSLKRWTRKVDIFSYNMVIVPIHLSLHWTLAVIDNDCKEIRYYDSMNGHNVECLKALRNYLRDEYSDKKSGQLDLSQWNFLHVHDVPQQMNGSDCGMFACKYAEFISRGKTTFCFNQAHMPYYRRRMVWEILNKKLI